jgi:hypothetical protein
MASSTTKTGRHDIAEILQKVALNAKKSSSSKGTLKYGQIRHVVAKYWFY